MRLQKFYIGVVAAALAVAEPNGAHAQNARQNSAAAVHLAVTDFLRAFENLDWERFRAAFAEDVTVFFPVPEPPQRFVGRVEVEAQFRRVFDAIRAAAPSGPPFQQLPPIDLRVEVLDGGTALVTFELHNAERIGRRTLVLRRDGGRWRIIHLHASNTLTARASPPGA